MTLNQSPCNILTPKVSALEISLQQTNTNFKALVSGFEQLCIDMESYKIQLETLKGKCESKNCISSEVLKKVIASKDNIIKQIASALITFKDTNNTYYLQEIFKIIFDEPHNSIPEEILEIDYKICDINVNKDIPRSNFNIKKEYDSPIKGINDTKKIETIKDETISEIESTPTGRTSPIIQSRKPRCFTTTNSTSSDVRDKKKCPDDWIKPEPKSMKLIFVSPSSGGSGRYRQTRLNLEEMRQKKSIDVTNSPEILEHLINGTEKKIDVQKIIRKESSENDDTILPSPTSAHGFLPYKLSKDKLDKKRPLSLKSKTEGGNVKLEQEKTLDLPNPAEMEESINILKPNRLTRKHRESPQKRVKIKSEPIEDENIDVDSSMSLLQHVANLEHKENLNKPNPTTSPPKRPLSENANLTNMQSDTQASVSLLQHDVIVQPIFGAENIHKRKTPEKLEPIYKEPTVRKKSEKLALPGWVCEECKTFINEMYAADDDPLKIEKILARCSKHRGRNNPARPSTPPGFWPPRWDVPQDTEEFNKRNNAA